MTIPDSKTPARASTAPTTKTAQAPAPEVDESVVEDDASAAPERERVTIGGMVLDKVMHPDGECETNVVSEPQIDPELVRSTRALQRARGH